VKFYGFYESYRRIFLGFLSGKGGVAMLRANKIMFLSGFFFIIIFTRYTFAFPPVGSADESYYEGIWNFRISERCYRIADAGVVSLPVQDVFMTLEWAGTAYQARVYPTIKDARWGTNGLGETVFSFDWPSGEESSVPDIEGTVHREHPKFTGSCEVTLFGSLKTAVNNSQNPRLSKVSGWGFANCEPDDMNTHPFLKCRVNLFGKWIEGLPPSNGCQTNADCSSGDYCEKAPGDCSGAGNCKAVPDVCSHQVDPVCGCDGFTYANACEGERAGTNVAYSGQCQ
jgi:hypothetical protein